MLTFHRGIGLRVALFAALSLTVTARANPPRTGSRIPRQEATASAPVTVFEREQLEALGLLSLGELLQSITVHSGFIGTPPFGSERTLSTSLHLRSLGEARTLVLLNGHRYVASGIGSELAVDLNSLPITAIQRVEILQGGGSSIYGSDAIGGVVNIITRESASGGEVRLLSGLSNFSAGLRYDLSLATGQSAERGNILFTAGYSDVLAFAGAPALSIGGPFAFPSGPPRQHVQLYTTGTLRLIGASSAFFEASYSRRESSLRGASTFFGLDEDLVVSADNLYNPSGSPVSGRKLGAISFGSFKASADMTTFRLVTGLGGKLSERFGPLRGFTWELAYNHGRTQGISTQQGLLQRSRLESAIGPSFVDPTTGKATCGTPAAPIEGCVPLNLFGGPGGITPEMVESLREQGTAHGVVWQNSVTAHLVGELFKLAPDVNAASLAVGYEHRREGGAYVPDPLAAKGESLLGREARGEGRYAVNEAYAELSVPVLGATDPLKGTSRDRLEVRGAARVFRYNLFGTDFAYLLGTHLRVIPDVTVRAAYSREFRAPTVAEISPAQISSFVRVTDPCSASTQGSLRQQGTSIDALCDAQGVPDDLYDPRAQQRIPRGGNPELQPETANILRAGLVLEPRFLESFTASVDYSLFQVNRAIVRAGAESILNSCYPHVAGRSLFCDNIERDEQGLITAIRDPLFNGGTDVASSVDLSLRYQPQTPLGRFGLGVDANWPLRVERTLADSMLAQDNTTQVSGGANGRWKANVRVSWARGGLGASARMRFVNGFSECMDSICTPQEEGAPEPVSRLVSDYYSFDANVAYGWEMKTGTATAQLGVINLFDVAPAYIANSFTGGFDSLLYEYRGRYFYLRLAYSYD